MMRRINEYGEDAPPEKDWRDRLDSDSTEYQVRDVWEKYGRKIKLGIAGFLTGITLLSGVYTIPQDSEGVVTTFGRYSRTSKPGIHLKIPGVEHVRKIPTQAISTESIGFRALKSGVKSEYIDLDSINQGKVGNNHLEEIITEEGLNHEGNLREEAKNVLRSEFQMLTGDLNMADVEFIVQYKISDPVAYSFNIRNPRSAIRDVSEAKMRVVVGDASVDEVLTAGRSYIESKVKVALQDRLNFYDSGLEIVTVKLQSTQPPERVRGSFNEVNAAIAQRQQKINQAMSEYNKQIPRAKGEAQAMIQKAEGYATERVNNSQGDVARFRQVFEQYKNAPDITRARLYLEAMPEILGNAKEIIYLEGSGGKGDLFLKKLDLNQNNGGERHE